jgi:hypothetical protein
MTLAKLGTLLTFCLFAVLPASAGSWYEHPLLKGGGTPSTEPDFPQKLSEFIAAKGSGKTGESLLRSYYGRDRHNARAPQLIVAFAKDKKDLIMSLMHNGKRANHISNEPFLWVVLFVEEGAPIMAERPAPAVSPVMMQGQDRDVCFKEDSHLQVKLEGLAYEEKAGPDVMELIQRYTGKEPTVKYAKPLDSECAAVDFSRAAPLSGTGIRKGIIKFPLTKESVYRVLLQPTREQQSSSYHVANLRLAWWGAGVGAGAVRDDGFFKKATVKPNIFGHFYISKFFNPWNRSLAIAGGLPLEKDIDEVSIGLRWSPVNEWKNQDFGRIGLIAGYNYHRPVDRYAGSERQWRFFAGVDYKL